MPPIDLRHGPHSTAFAPKIDRDIISGKLGWLWLAPPCTTYSSLQNLRRGGPLRTKDRPYGDPSIERVAHGNACWGRSCELARLIHHHGGQFIIEHPANSFAWQLSESIALYSMPGVHKIKIDQCMHGAATLKPTYLLTNAPWVLPLEIRCSHDHVHAAHLVGSAASQAASYPPGLCRSLAAARARWERRDGCRAAAAPL